MKYVIKLYKGNTLVGEEKFSDEQDRSNNALRVSRDWHDKADSWEFTQEHKQ